MRVPFYDTDAMGVVHHANYLRYFENGRVEWFRQRGIVYGSWLGDDTHLAVVDSHVRYRLAARFDDVLIIEAKLDEVNHASLRFSYRVLDANEEVIAEGTTLHACVSGQIRLKRFPRHVRQALLAGMDRPAAGASAP